MTKPNIVLEKRVRRKKTNTKREWHVPSPLRWDDYLTFGGRGIVFSGKYNQTRSPPDQKGLWAPDQT